MAGSENPQTRVMLVDDHEVVREGLQRMLSLSDDLEIVGAVGSGEEALREASILEPDVLLLDLRLPGIHGLEVIRSLIGGPGRVPRILVLTVHDDSEIVLEAVRGGAQGYVLKDASAEELIAAIRRVASGGQYFDSVVVRALLEDDKRDQEHDLLTEREIEVLRLLASGFTNREIAEHLYLSTDTVKTHLSNIYRKLGVSDRAHAVAVALRKGLLE